MNQAECDSFAQFVPTPDIPLPKTTKTYIFTSSVIRLLVLEPTQTKGYCSNIPIRKKAQAVVANFLCGYLCSNLYRS